MSGPEQHIAATRRRLAHLAELAAKTEAAERSILKHAEHRLGVVQADADRLHGRALGDDDAADRYLAAVHEMRMLRLVIAKAHKVLGPPQ